MNWKVKTESSSGQGEEKGFRMLFRAARRRLFFDQEEKTPTIEEEIERARARCRAAEERFLSISDPEMTDYAVYEMEAACRQYAYLVRLREAQAHPCGEKDTQGDVHTAAAVVK